MKVQVGDENEAGVERLGWLLSATLILSALAIAPPGLDTESAMRIPQQLALLCGGAAAFTFVAVRGVSLRWTPPAIFAAAFLCAEAVAASTGRASVWAAFHSVALDAAAFALSLAAVLAGRRPGVAERLAETIVWSATAVCSLAIAEACGLELPWGELRRPVSTLGNRNQVAALAAFALPLALGGLATHRRFAVPRVVVLATTVTLCRTRSAWLALLVAIVCAVAVLAARGRLVGFLGSKPFRTGAAAVVGAVLITAWVPWPGLGWSEPQPLCATLGRLVDYSHGTGSERLADHRVGVSILAQHPLLGVGPDGWSDAANEHAHSVPGRHAEPWGPGRAPRSQWLLVATESGLVGLCCLLMLISVFARAWLRDLFSRVGTSSMLPMLSMLTVLVIACFDLPFEQPSLLAATMVLAGLQARELKWRTPSDRRVPRPALLTGSLLAALSAVVLLASHLIAMRKEPEALAAALRLRPDQIGLERLASEGVKREGCARSQGLLTRAMHGAPHHLGNQCLAARCALEAGDLPAARALYDEALRTEPHLSDQVAKSPRSDCHRVDRALRSAAGSP